MTLSNQEQKQYDRHLILDEIGIKGQLKLKQAKVLVVGAGGLGCPILQYLTAAGVGTIGIIDHDTIDQSNLQRQILYTHDDIGKFKAEISVKKLSKLNPFVTFQTYIEKLTSKNVMNLFSKYDIIVDGSDNFPTRYLVNDAAVLTNKPVVFGSIFKFEGQVSVFNYQNGPTYRCLYPTAPNPNTVPNCSQIGVLGVLPSIIGSFQANEVIKIICNIGNILSGKLLNFNALTMTQLLLDFKKNAAIAIKTLDSNYDLSCGLVKQGFQTITIKQLNQNPEEYNLLDVREANERAIHHIGGQHIPLGELTNRFNEINTNKDLIVYCKSGVRSKIAIQLLKDKGWTDTILQLEALKF
ncbi:molybdopterin-synthase adenylyltransferase MoeB [uncultured Olleya sp.]|uniref:molybdopterin-synthase adenylyltransferase MoeB n=1 Tax=uncultured Olleya sp. TaxID=757243 RepID=UPI002599EE2B|nr:molybdopterin-synthase adenylyltransferase MoeB [uncultured Olleya sp.]